MKATASLIRRLLDDGLITMTVPEKPNSRLQRYRVTAQGEALLAYANAHNSQEILVP